RAYPETNCRAQITYSVGWPARSCHSRTHLCQSGTGLRRRTRIRNGTSSSKSLRRYATVGIQNTRARSICDAADRREDCARCPSLAASGRCCASQRRLQRYSASHGSLRRDFGGGREEVERDWPAVWNRKGQRRYCLSAKSAGGFSESIMRREHV